MNNESQQHTVTLIPSLCTQCGNELPNGAVFCTVCGTRVSSPPEPYASAQQTQAPAGRRGKNAGESFEGKKKTGKKPLIIAIVIVVVALVGIGAYFFLNNMVRTNYANQVVEALQNQEYTEALAVFGDKIGDDNIEVLETSLSQRLDTIKTEFRDGDIEYSVAVMELDTIRMFRIAGLSSKTSAVELYVEDLNSSRTAFNTAEALFKSGEYVEAINQYKQVIAEDPNYEDAKTGINRAVGEYRSSTLDSAKDYADNDDYDRAITIIGNALLSIPNDSELTQQLNIYQTQQTNYKRQLALDAAADFASVNDWANAIKTLENALGELAGDAMLEQQLSDYRGRQEAYSVQQESEKRQSVLDAAAGFAAADDWANAIGTLETALREMTGDPALTSRLNEYKASYVSYVTNQVNTLLAQKEYDDATSIVNKALLNIPGDADLQELLRKIDDSRPISVFTLEPLNSNRWGYNEGVLEDSLGRTYSVTYPYKVAENGNYAEYYVNGNYSAITGRIVPHKDFDANEKVQFRVYADDVLVYSSTDINQKTLEFTFDVNISGAEFIKIEVARTIGGRSYYGGILIMDMVLEK